METIILVAIIGSIASNFYFARKVHTTVNLPSPIVNVTVEAPEAVEMEAAAMEAPVCRCDHEILQIILEKLNHQIIPNYPIPTPMYPNPVYPTYFPIISETGTDFTVSNEKEIDGVKGKQFPSK